MLKKFLKDAVTLIVGKQAEEIVDLLDTSKYINEFVIAKKLDMTINQARNILYKISDYGLVSSTRKKDKKKGWYTYFWKIEVLKSLEFVRNDILKKIDSLEHQIKSRETKRFYICEKCHLELNEENALLQNFTCPECGSILMIKDNTKLIKEMGKNLEKLRKDLVLIEEEISKEDAKHEQKRLKKIKKEEKEKKKARKKSIKKSPKHDKHEKNKSKKKIKPGNKKTKIKIKRKKR